MKSNALRKETVAQPRHSPQPRPSQVQADPAQPEQRRIRNCLKCNDKFESAWAGERICRRCKGSSSWQTGGLDGASARAGR